MAMVGKAHTLATTAVAGHTLNPSRSLYRLPIILGCFHCSSSSFVCLSASCLPCSFGVACYAFKKKTGKMLNNTQNLHRP